MLCGEEDEDDEHEQRQRPAECWAAADLALALLPAQ